VHDAAKERPDSKYAQTTTKRILLGAATIMEK
jgi:hypothetical protein